MPVKVVDFFSGCGGTSAGLRTAGLDIILGLDKDSDAANTYRFNFPEAAFVEADIRRLPVEALEPYLEDHLGHTLLFSGCAPCQPFSRQNRRGNDKENQASLLYEFLRFVEYYVPDFVFVENVPRLDRATAEGDRQVFADFVESLDNLGYCSSHGVVRAQDYGVPQRRERLVLVGSFGPRVTFPSKTHGPDTLHAEYATVWEWIGDLPAIGAGEEHSEVPNHRAANLSELNMQRIRATPVGGGRRDWPEELRLECHSKGYQGHTDVYGRMHKYRPASGLTTRCISLSNGRFGHPEQDRAISVREAACLQTFSRDFLFHGSLASMARQVGNAVPPLMAQRFGEWVVRNLEVSGTRQMG